MSPKIFTTLTLVTAAAAGITALALHAPAKTECACDEHAYVTPKHELHTSPGFERRHFARPPAPEPMPAPEPAPVA